MTRFLIADESPIARRVIWSILSVDPENQLVGEADSGDAAVEATTRLSPDFAIVEMSLSPTNGIDVTRRIRAVSPGTRVIVMTVYPERLYAEVATQAGASAFLVKESAFVEIHDAIEAIRDGRVYITRRVGPSRIGSMSGREIPAKGPSGLGKTPAA
ncbi:response regulator transcription factor [bacterium]|nr:response regulator transcription factor [bacterium]